MLVSYREAATSLRLFFFFQAEDGIRDLTVTGVQTCALPISLYRTQGAINPLELRRTILKYLPDDHYIGTQYGDRRNCPKAPILRRADSSVCHRIVRASIDRKSVV